MRRYIPPHMRNDQGAPAASARTGQASPSQVRTPPGPQHNLALRQPDSAQLLPGQQNGRKESSSLNGISPMANNVVVDSLVTHLAPAMGQNSPAPPPYVTASQLSETQEPAVTELGTVPAAALTAGASSADQALDSTALQDESAAASEEKRRQRRFREGFGAYTAPPVLGRLERAGKPKNPMVSLLLQGHWQLSSCCNALNVVSMHTMSLTLLLTLCPHSRSH